MYVVDCKIEESLADNNINIDITKTRVLVMSMFMLLSANDSSILQSTTYRFTPFEFGNTVCSQLTTNIHWPCFCNVYVYVIESKGSKYVRCRL
jgi:hypothetical protein